MAESFKELDVWRVSMELAVVIADIALKFPREYRWLSDQVMRSSESVPSNIAEGFDRKSNGDFVRFLRIAKASLGETESHLTYAHLRRLITDNELSRMNTECTRVRMMLNRFISYLNKRGMSTKADNIIARTSK